MSEQVKFEVGQVWRNSAGNDLVMVAVSEFGEPRYAYADGRNGGRVYQGNRHSAGRWTFVASSLAEYNNSPPVPAVEQPTVPKTWPAAKPIDWAGKALPTAWESPEMPFDKAALAIAAQLLADKPAPAPAPRFQVGDRFAVGSRGGFAEVVDVDNNLRCTWHDRLIYSDDAALAEAISKGVYVHIAGPTFKPAKVAKALTCNCHSQITGGPHGDYCRTLVGGDT